MRNARKLLLLAVMALAALALSAPSAFAQDIEVDGEFGETTQHCPEIFLQDHAVEGGCFISADSEGTIELGAQVPIFGYIHQDNCNNQYDVYFDENGEGYVAGFNITPGDPTCGDTTRPCNTEAGETHPGNSNNPWRAHGNEIAAGVTRAVITVCLRTGNSLFPECEGAFNVNITETNPDGSEYEAVTPTARTPIGSSVCRVTGHWILTPADPSLDGIHITHL